MIYCFCDSLGRLVIQKVFDYLQTNFVAIAERRFTYYLLCVIKQMLKLTQDGNRYAQN